MTDAPATTSASFIPTRSIGGFTATVTIIERHRDAVTITEFPVETGTSISDHAYKRPSEVRLSIGSQQTSSMTLQMIYQQLLALQSSFVPFMLLTGKRSYSNMLIAELSVDTDEKTENVLMAEVMCREVILVSTQTTSVSSDPTVHADPSKTAPIQNMGTQQLQPTGLSVSDLTEVGLAGPSGLN